MKTPSQTVGPYYTIGLSRGAAERARRPGRPRRRAPARRAPRRPGRRASPDGMVEAWDPAGKRWGRSGTDAEGRFSFVLTKPEALPGQAPRLDVFVFARGLAPPPADPRVLPGRSGERDRPRPCRARRARPRDPGCHRRGRRSTVRYPDAGRNRLLRALTTFEALYVPAPIREAVSDEAWLAAMLDAERALGPDEDVFRPEDYDIAALCEEGQADASPVVPLVRALRERAPDAHGPATSQDILDTAAMLVSKRARELVLAELDGVAAACAGLAETHRSTPMIARTLLQQAVPTTFGLKAAGWLVAVVDARRRLAAVTLPAQLGGPGRHARSRPRRRASPPRSASPSRSCPWHVHRRPVARARRRARRRRGRVREDRPRRRPARADRGRRGRRSPAAARHRRCRTSSNPASAVLARACARLVHANAGLLTGGDYEHERAAGAWQAEWPALSAALAFAGGAAAAARRSLEGLRSTPPAWRRTSPARTPARRRRSSTARSRTTGSRRERSTTASTARRTRRCSSSRTRSARRYELWDPQIAAFAEHFRVLRYDQLGHGRSDVPPGPYTVELLGRRAARAARRARDRALLLLRALARRRRRPVARRERAGAGRPARARGDVGVLRAAGAVDRARRARPRGGARRGRRRRDGAVVHGGLRRLGALARRARGDAARGLRRVLRRARGLGLPRRAAAHHRADARRRRRRRPGDAAGRRGGDRRRRSPARSSSSSRTRRTSLNVEQPEAFTAAVLDHLAA